MKWFLLSCGLAAAYLIVRPAFHAIPAFKAFYDDADTFWRKAWAVCGKSATVLWGYVLSFLAAVWSILDPLAQLFGAPDIKQQILELLKDHPQYASYFLIGVSVVTIAARMRSIRKDAGK
ncbi:hypothetical protein [Bradyrhizobium cenepequi]|uniref:hypothetical protein n=1 Tax=Bradyrhizobium cenepequi TaxID=2821403 RepID=UPI001CE2F372|nr:hypothetical protein [Bradyrhizobium cenepequi]MCA6108087.1 hypothetical protein [Bradyrhizobium cenepequi]